jgi:hypothetical protein
MPLMDELCPYQNRHFKGEPAGMTPQGDGTRRCGRCGHADKPGDSAYSCSCNRCKTKQRSLTGRGKGPQTKTFPTSGYGSSGKKTRKRSRKTSTKR